jgi:hypothetical protein
MIMNLHSHSICAILCFEKKREEKGLLYWFQTRKFKAEKKKIAVLFFICRSTGHFGQRQVYVSFKGKWIKLKSGR